MTITRTMRIDVTVNIACCRENLKSYTPQGQQFHKTLTVTKESFEESLTIWRDRIHQAYDDYLYKKAKDECEKGVSRRLCEYTADWSRTTVEEIEEKPTKPRYVPKYIRDMIDYLEEQKEKYKDYPATVTKIQDEIDRLKERYGID